MILSKNITLAFEDNCFCFQVTGIFTKKKKKWILIQKINVYKGRPVFDKKTYLENESSNV